MAHLELHFTDDENPSLWMTKFSVSSVGPEIKSTRGDFASVSSESSFRWTAAVKALSLLIIRHVLYSKSSFSDLNILVGDKGSQAASLDYAIAKQPGWILDMFGKDSEGFPLIKKLVQRSNPERKRPGPVSMSINSRLLSIENIKIYIGETHVTEHDKLKFLEEILTEDNSQITVKDLSKPSLDHSQRVELSISKILLGFLFAIAASSIWGIGNVVTRWSAERIPSASYDIAVIKYLAAGFLLLLIGLFAFPQKDSVKGQLRLWFAQNTKFLFLAAVLKGLNTYVWILGVTYVPAGIVATFENMHVIWLALLLMTFFKERLAPSWIIGALVVTIGSVLISGLSNLNSIPPDTPGLFLGLLSGITFAGFILVWSRFIKHSKTLGERSIEMAALLFLSTVVVYPVHIIVSAMWVESSLVPLTELGYYDGIIQGLNGLIGIGITYFLLNEANSLLRSIKGYAGLLLGIGLSFAVPITLLTEWAFLELEVSTEAWIGCALFVLGYINVKIGLQKLEAKLQRGIQS